MVSRSGWTRIFSGRSSAALGAASWAARSWLGHPGLTMGERADLVDQLSGRLVLSHAAKAGGQGQLRLMGAALSAGLKHCATVD